MTWFADLSPCTYFPAERVPSGLTAVGWLSAARPFPQGAVSDHDLAWLGALLVQPFQPFVAAGFHGCELCRDPARFTTDLVGGHRVTGGSANVFVPGPGLTFYAAPSMIGHYVVQHGYAPPAPFLEAARACPPMSSGRYLLVVLERMPAWRSSVLFELAQQASRGELHEGVAGLFVVQARDELERALTAPEHPAQVDAEWAARVLGAAGSLARDALPALERALEVFHEEPHAGVIEEAIARVRSG